MEDQIFKLNGPVDEKPDTPECLYCGDVFKKSQHRHKCNFCGHNMCQKCSRYRTFEVPQRDG